jgi:hypothetical protein
MALLLRMSLQLLSISLRTAALQTRQTSKSAVVASAISVQIPLGYYRQQLLLI